MNPSPTDDPLDLVHQVVHRVRTHQRQALREQAELSPMDARVLGYFGRRPGSTLKDLAEHSGRDKAQLARLIKGLRESGWLRAQTDPEDRRNQRLWLTEAGEALHQRMTVAMREVSRRAVQGLTVEQHRVLVELLGRVRDNL